MTIRNALILAVSILLISAALSLAAKADVIDSNTEDRAMGVIIGLVLVVMANLAPKSLEPMCSRSDPARIQALQRFTGWTLVLAGLGYAMAWLVLPIDRAGAVAMSAVATGLGLVLIRLAWVVWASRGAQPSVES